MIKVIIFEFRKNFLKKSIFLAIILFTLINLIKINSIYNEESLLSNNTDPTWSKLYWDVYDEFSGPIAMDKIGKLMAIYEPLNSKTADRTASTRMDNPNTYTGNIYNDTYFFKWNFVDPMEYAYTYSNYAENVVIRAKENLVLFQSLDNQYEYKKNEEIVKLYSGRTVSNFSYLEMYKSLMDYDFSSILVILICIYVLINIYVFENETEMNTFLLTTELGGTKTVLAKIYASFIFVILISLWFWIIDFIAFAITFGSLEGGLSPVYAIENFVNSSVSINLWEYIIVSYLLKTIGTLVLAIFILLISLPFKNTLAPFVLSTVLIFTCIIYIQEISAESSRIFLKVINPFILIYNGELFRKTEFVELLGYPVISYLAALLFSISWMIFCIFSIYLLVKRNTFYRKGIK